MKILRFYTLHFPNKFGIAVIKKQSGKTPDSNPHV